MYSKNTTTRKIHLDILRIIAICCVIFNHTNEKGIFLFSISENTVLKPIYAFPSILCNVAVPLFFMISGALLIPKEESLKDLYKKRGLRILLVILLFSFGQYLYQVLFRGTEFSLFYFFNTIISSEIIIPYWYLYSYAAYILILPFLRKLSLKMSGQDYLYLLALQLTINGLYPIISYFGKLGDLNLYLPLLDNIIFYPLIGHYIENQLPDTYYKKKYAFTSILISFSIICLFVYITLKQALVFSGALENENHLFLTSLIAIPVITIYYLLKFLCKTWSMPFQLQKLIMILGETTFGIYLLEERFREYFVFVDIKLAPIIGAMPACMIWILITFTSSFFATFILKRIPGINKIL